MLEDTDLLDAAHIIQTANDKDADLHLRCSHMAKTGFIMVWLIWFLGISRNDVISPGLSINLLYIVNKKNHVFILYRNKIGAT